MAKQQIMLENGQLSLRQKSSLVKGELLTAPETLLNGQRANHERSNLKPLRPKQQQCSLRWNLMRIQAVVRHLIQPWVLNDPRDRMLRPEVFAKIQAKLNYKITLDPDISKHRGTWWFLNKATMARRGTCMHQCVFVCVCVCVCVLCSIALTRICTCLQRCSVNEGAVNLIPTEEAVRKHKRWWQQQINGFKVHPYWEDHGGKSQGWWGFVCIYTIRRWDLSANPQLPMMSITGESHLILLPLMLF